mmetsp:Transcript_29987/g.54400  ORF Transcript_29987/g.54400 Transcript_29987/m.54400 type:complete len:297 (+) Transcript_29987:1005-1895(+)
MQNCRRHRLCLPQSQQQQQQQQRERHLPCSRRQQPRRHLLRSFSTPLQASPAPPRSLWQQRKVRVGRALAVRGTRGRPPRQAPSHSRKERASRAPPGNSHNQTREKSQRGRRQSQRLVRSTRRTVAAVCQRRQREWCLRSGCCRGGAFPRGLVRPPPPPPGSPAASRQRGPFQHQQSHRHCRPTQGGPLRCPRLRQLPHLPRTCEEPPATFPRGRASALVPRRVVPPLCRCLLASTPRLTAEERACESTSGALPPHLALICQPARNHPRAPLERKVRTCPSSSLSWVRGWYCDEKY